VGTVRISAIGVLVLVVGLVGLVLGPATVQAKPPADGPSIPSVGARVDGPPPSPPGGPSGSPQGGSRSHSWRAIDGHAFQDAKDAANAAAQGLAQNARNDFTISASPTTASVVQGTGAQYTITTRTTSGRSQSLTLSLSSTPGGVTGTFNPTHVTSGGGSTLTVPATAVAPATYTLRITASGSSATHSTSVTLNVTTPAAADFAIAANPSSLAIAQGGSAQSSITSTQVGSAGVVSVTVGVSPSAQGVTGSLSPASIAAGGVSTLTVDVAANAVPGPYTVTVTGTEGAANHQTLVGVTVSPPSAGPSVGPSWIGQSESDLAPPDPTGAIGPGSYIQLINLRFAIYDRTGALVGPGAAGDLGALTGLPLSELSDPQVLWDPSAQRFYYSVLDTARYGFAFGYSKTASPQSAADFCQYITDFGYGSSASLPDYPKLAVTSDYVLIGSNVFLLSALYKGSDVDWFVKPASNPSDNTCPSSLGAGGIFSKLKNADGSLTSTPVPAVNAESSSTGWIVGSANVGSGSAAYLSVFKVTKGVNGAVISGPTALSVASYSVPADAIQPGVSAVLDTMDTRLTHAVAGYDPRLGSAAVWTAHTVFGGAGAEARWYEINVGGTPAIAQSGKVSDASFFVWNGAISPDRASDDTTGLTGSDMAMGFNTSSTSADVAIQVVSKHGSLPQSAWVLVHQSQGANVDFTCGPTCRWGDYGGALPDPLVSSGGRVWLSNEWNNPQTDGSTPVWQTWNWATTP
jgi:hypothetical protein